ncbi:MAG: WbqC family protein [bacterium]|nr:WbqC family protein [bacterium]
MPWIGFFDKMARSDIFVFLDNVQFTKNSFQNRTRILTSQGPQWLTVPVLTKGAFQQLTRDVLIDNKLNWRKKHLKTLELNYRKASYFHSVWKSIWEIYQLDCKKLVDFTKPLILLLAEKLKIKGVKFVSASDLDVKGQGSELLLNICRSLKVDTYLSGPSGRKYLDLQSFQRSNIKVQFHEFTHPIYKQQYGSFTPGMSAIDLIFNCEATVPLG